MVREYARSSRDGISAFFDRYADDVIALADAMVESLKAGGKIVFFGNGGSAADSQHLATEITGRYLKNRPALASVALTTDTSSLTASGNDFGFDQVFARQVEALVKKEDVVVGMSTSGNSPNVLLAFDAARKIGALTVGWTGKDGGRMPDHCDRVFIVPTPSTPIIQQVHMTMGHLICGMVEDGMFPNESGT